MKNLLIRFGNTLLALSLFCTTALLGQSNPTEGLRDNTPKVHALTHVRIIQRPGQVIEKGTVIIRDGSIAAVGANVDIPPDARVWDYSGLTLSAGFIDAYASIAPPAKKATTDGEKQGKSQGKNKTDSEPRYWNPLIRPEANVLDTFKATPKDINAWRKQGFTNALVVPTKGILRGSSTLINLTDGSAHDQVLREDAAQHAAFDRVRSRAQGYPTSEMGAISLIRQAMLDAQWYRAARRAYQTNPANQVPPELNVSLEKLSSALGQSRFIFEVSDDLDVFRAQKIATEFELNWMIRGSGYEYRILPTLKQVNLPVIVSLDFPEAPDLSSPEATVAVTLQELRHWELAPQNPARLEKAGVPFAFTSAKLKKDQHFQAQVRKAITAGLSQEAALAAVTTVPAHLLGVEDQLGTIFPGKLANLQVSNGEPFGDKTDVIDVWVAGARYHESENPDVDLRGKWWVHLQQEGFADSLTLTLEGEPRKLSGSLARDTVTVKPKKIDLELHRLAFRFDGTKFGVDGIVSLSGLVQSNLIKGQGLSPNGHWFGWSARRMDSSKQANVKPEPTPSATGIASDTTPVSATGAFDYAAIPEQPAILMIRNATLWTSGPAGNLENADLLVKNGKIAKVGKDLKVPSGAEVVDATGKHVTPGLIDAHSHSGITRGINEVGQAVTAEVSIADVINSHDIAFYRELAGGLTTANQLHGSANPIGGQNSVVKLRWGSPPSGLRFEDAIPGIKFALGENVKQSNWGDKFTTRYPQTRMGVEQLIRDRFKAAQDYERKWTQYRGLKNKQGVIPPRRDLELDALVEILHGERLVHSHSYRQDEILMLLRIAEDFGFKIGTFQHVLEGYKVAEALASHGAGASTFSDWWAYKFEVYDAIPYNGALMHDAGVVVSFNSDSGELARRLNLEAAKAVKYGGISPEEALKFVTLNPARQLHIDNRVGSLEAGKDADFVIWSGSPLSTYTKCEQTWIDGRRYFDIELDRQLRQRVAAERNRLIQKILAETPGQPGAAPPKLTMGQ